MAKLKKQKKSPLLLIGIVAFFLLLIAGVYYKYNYPTSSNEITSWKTYETKTGKFSIQYPTDWKVTEERTDLAVTPNEINSVTFSGKEGEVVLGWDEPFGGGGCDGSKILKLKQIELTGCNDIVDNVEYWNLFTYQKNSSSYVVHMGAKADPSSNAPLIRKIFSTLTFVQ